MADTKKHSVHVISGVKGFILSGNITFPFLEKEQTFQETVEAFDSFITEFRNEAIKEMAKSQGGGVEWVN